ncbi:type IV secretory system conjugative DNA transfer family protein [Pseudomonas guariconensis]|uniref:type IV secretory system conjugative DNA transfer family protein n=1 Tax=Pseudomonas guariconensis TaxID=1288410 RepID=UPI00300D84A3
MKRIFALLPLVVSLAVHAGETPDLDASGQTSAPVVETAPPDLNALLKPQSKATTKVTDIRNQLLTDMGNTVGFRGGMAARARELVDGLNARSPSLDAMFKFAPMIAKNGTLPPVIVEARDVAAFSQDQVRTANRVYKIEREERFVSVPPTWRDYLYVGLPLNASVELPDFEARPQDSDEAEIWEVAVRKGWDDGYKQADAILAANFNRLTRDYLGMHLYSSLLQNDMISSTSVAESQQTVTGDGKQMMLGDKLRRVTGRATFEIDPKKWRPTVKTQLRQTGDGATK